MRTIRVADSLAEVLRGLNPAQMKEVFHFTLFLKSRPEQAYFWTPKWQAKERSASSDKRLGHVVGDGNVEDLIKSLHSHS